MKNIEEKNLDKVAGGTFIKGEDGLYYQVREGSGLTEEEKKIADVIMKLGGPMMGGPGMNAPMIGGPGMGGFGLGGPGMGHHGMGHRGMEHGGMEDNIMPEPKG